jgi:hypothetical protein
MMSHAETLRRLKRCLKETQAGLDAAHARVAIALREHRNMLATGAIPLAHADFALQSALRQETIALREHRNMLAVYRLAAAHRRTRGAGG